MLDTLSAFVCQQYYRSKSQSEKPNAKITKTENPNSKATEFDRLSALVCHQLQVKISNSKNRVPKLWKMRTQIPKPLNFETPVTKKLRTEILKMTLSYREKISSGRQNLAQRREMLVMLKLQKGTSVQFMEVRWIRVKEVNVKKFGLLRWNVRKFNL